MSSHSDDITDKEYHRQVYTLKVRRDTGQISEQEYMQLRQELYDKYKREPPDKENPHNTP